MSHDTTQCLTKADDKTTSNRPIGGQEERRQAEERMCYGFICFVSTIRTGDQKTVNSFQLPTE